MLVLEVIVNLCCIIDTGAGHLDALNQPIAICSTHRWTEIRQLKRKIALFLIPAAFDVEIRGSKELGDKAELN